MTISDTVDYEIHSEAIGMLLSRIGVEPVVDLSAPLSTNLASQEALLQQLREIESQ